MPSFFFFLLCHCVYNISVSMINIELEFSSPLPPENVIWTTNYLPSNMITFTWNTNSPDCPAIHYNILASNCGSCPTTTNYTTVTCTDVPTDGSMCTFAVQTVVCGNITGESSQALLFNNNVQGQLKYLAQC